MGIKLVVDEDYLIVHTLAKGRSSSENVLAFQNEVWKECRDDYRKIQKVGIRGVTPKSIKGDNFTFLENFLPKVKKLDGHKLLVSQTIKYQEMINHEFIGEFGKTLKLVEEITGLTINKDKYNFVIYPMYA